MRLVIGEHTIDCTNRTAIMAILNVGTDSPIAESVVAASSALDRARTLRDQGAAIIDVGAHSTRTGAEAVAPQEEIDRLCPVVDALAREGFVVSIDTWTGAVAQATAEAGAHILNDVSAGADPVVVRVAAQRRLPLIIMHMRGEPTRHREADQRYDDVGAEVRTFLASRTESLTAAGVSDIWFDPGFQFGKSVEDNLRLLDDLPNLVALGRPVVVSASRKGFLSELLGEGYGQQATGLVSATVAFNVLAAAGGTHIVRVHDVAEIAAALRIVNGARGRRDGTS
jgi:dihydropteroate synthase